MKISRYIKAMTLCIAVATMLASCDKDGDFLTTSGGDDVTLDGTTSDIVLDYSHLNALALTVYWNENGDISLSNPLVAAPGYAVDNTIQFSADEDFTSTNDLLMGKGVFERQFTVGELNNILGKLGFAGGVKAPLYIRVKSVLGDNLAPRYSNVLVVNVTPYVIDMTVGKILSSSLDETGKTLYSPEGNSVYSGFVGAGAWENWWLREGDGTTWGNVGDDGGGTPFVISSNDQAWNFWYPGQSGCYYTVLLTEAGQ